MIYPGPSLGRAPPESVFKSGSPPKTTRLSECVDSRGQEGVVFTILGLCPVARALDLSLHNSRALGFWGIHFLYPKTSLHGSESRGCSSGPLKADMIPRGQGLGLFTVTSNPFCRGGSSLGRLGFRLLLSYRILETPASVPSGRGSNAELRRLEPWSI